MGWKLHPTNDFRIIGPVVLTAMPHYSIRRPLTLNTLLKKNKTNKKMCYLPTPVVILERRSVRVTIGRFCAIAIRSGCILFWAVFGCFLIRSNNRWYTALRWSYAEFCTDYIIENTSLSFMAYTPTFKKNKMCLWNTLSSGSWSHGGRCWYHLKEHGLRNMHTRYEHYLA